MNKVFMFLLGGFLLTGVSYAQVTPPAAPAPVPVVATVKPVVHHHDRFPEIHKAMRKLREAKEDLQKAAKDFGGHKVKAIQAIDEALAELKAAMDFDKK